MKRATLMIGGTLVAFVVLTALVSYLWTPYGPAAIVSGKLADPSAAHPLGTDHLGRDIVSRLMVGARATVVVGVVAVALAAVGGIPLGVYAGMNDTRFGAGRARAWIGEGLMRTADVLYAFPALLLAILLAAAIGASTTTAMVAIGIATIPAFARLSRAATLTIMTQDFILAARASGTSTVATAVRHVLPNIAPVLGVQASVSFGIAILAEAGLSYLGLATPPPTPTWGRMLREGQNVLFSAPEQALWPGLAIALAVLGLNLLGDGLRDLLDPRLREVA
jgi:peptide/nickel transport system permease protein